LRLLIFLLTLLFTAPVAAQTTQPPPPVDPAIAQQVRQAQAELRGALQGAHGQALSDAQINAKLAVIPDVKAKIAAALAVLTPRLQDADARLAQLGPAPGPGQPPEAPAAADLRKHISAAREAVDGEVKLARLTQLVADQTSKALVAQLHGNFQARLWTRSRSIADPGLWTDLAGAAPTDFARFTDDLTDESARFSAAFAQPGRAFVMIVGVLLGILLIGPGRVGLNRLGVRRAQAVTGGGLRRPALALWLVLVAMITPIIGGQVIRGTLLGAGALTPDFDDLVRLVIRSVAFAAFLEGLGRALLSPKRPGLRLAPLGDELVQRVAPYPGLVGAAAGLATFVAGFNAAIGSSLATAVASDCVTLLIEMVATGAALLAMAQVRQASLEAAKDSPGGGSRAPWVVAVVAAWLALAGVLLAVLAGYLSLASILMRETVWIGAVLASLMLAMSFVGALFPALLTDGGAVGRAVRAAVGLSESTMEQLSVLASGLCQLAFVLLAWLAAVAPFGAGVGELTGRLGQIPLQLKIGQTAISPLTVLGGVGLFLAGLLVTRVVRRWLVTAYLPKTDLDLGVRNSVATMASYLGFVVAAVLGFAYLGLSFSQIALFASALSVGIGFGLQAIIGNFVSGLILLAERPVQVGDWVVIGDLEGDVKAINIRATEIEMADRSRLIVPNSDLVTKTVRNVTHGGSLGRVKIVLRVHDGSDPVAVRETILSHLTVQADVLSEPPPVVYLTDVVDGVLEFTALAYVASPRYALRVKSELLFGMVPDLKASGVTLASPATVVNVGLGDDASGPRSDATSKPAPETKTIAKPA
jgi:small-conductance mechanosensitive channel